jgi:hypothetical protein
VPIGHFGQPRQLAEPGHLPDHVLALLFGLVVQPSQMERAVEAQVSELLGRGDASRLCLQ